MTKKAFFILLCIVFALIMLTGCQLAQENAVETSKDSLIGVYVTYTLPNHTVENWSYEDERIFATAKRIKTGQSETTSFDFVGLEGIAFFSPIVQENNDNVSYLTTIIGPEVFDSKVGVHVTDDSSTEVTLVGKVYRSISSNWENRVLSYNPVYQTSGGEIYLLPGTNIGGGGTVKLEEGVTTNENGKNSVNGTSVELIDETINTTIKTIFKQMSVVDEIVDTTVVLPQEAPEHIKLNKDTTYIIVEEHGLNTNGQTEIVRTLLDTDAIDFTVKYIGDHGFAVGERIELKH